MLFFVLMSIYIPAFCNDDQSQKNNDDAWTPMITNLIQKEGEYQWKKMQESEVLKEFFLNIKDFDLPAPKFEYKEIEITKGEFKAGECKLNVISQKVITTYDKSQSMEGVYKYRSVDAPFSILVQNRRPEEGQKINKETLYAYEIVAYIVKNNNDLNISSLLGKLEDKNMIFDILKQKGTFFVFNKEDIDNVSDEKQKSYLLQFLPEEDNTTYVITKEALAKALRENASSLSICSEDKITQLADSAKIYLKNLRTIIIHELCHPLSAYSARANAEITEGFTCLLAGNYEVESKYFQDINEYINSQSKTYKEYINLCNNLMGNKLDLNSLSFLAEYDMKHDIEKNTAAGYSASAILLLVLGYQKEYGILKQQETQLTDGGKIQEIQRQMTGIRHMLKNFVVGNSAEAKEKTVNNILAHIPKVFPPIYLLYTKNDNRIFSPYAISDETGSCVRHHYGFVSENGPTGLFAAEISEEKSLFRLKQEKECLTNGGLKEFVPIDTNLYYRLGEINPTEQKSIVESNKDSADSIKGE